MASDSTVKLCKICTKQAFYAHGRCKVCYEYLRRYKKDRSEILWSRAAQSREQVKVTIKRKLLPLSRTQRYQARYRAFELLQVHRYDRVVGKLLIEFRFLSTQQADGLAKEAQRALRKI